MIHRRITALLCLLASLHLSVVAAATACIGAAPMGAMPGTEAAAAVTAQHGDHGGAASGAIPSQPASGESWRSAGSPPAHDHSCGAGSDASCCAGMVSCSAIVALAERGRAAPSVAIRDRAYAAPIERPLSFRATLEPPPPKA